MTTFLIGGSRCACYTCCSGDGSAEGKEMPEHASFATRIAQVALRIALPVLLLLSPLYLLVSPAFVRHEYSLAHVPASTRFDEAERLAISDTLIGYLRGWNTLDDVVALTTSEGESALNEREVRHMIDVKHVLSWFLGAQRLALGVAVLGIVWLFYAAGLASIGVHLQRAVLAAGLVILAVVVFSLIDFDSFFVLFHRLLFEDNTWTFWETDTLIQLYPLPFWVDAVWKLGAVILVELGLAYALGAWLGGMSGSESG